MTTRNSGNHSTENNKWYAFIFKTKQANLAVSIILGIIIGGLLYLLFGKAIGHSKSLKIICYIGGLCHALFIWKKDIETNSTQELLYYFSKDEKTGIWLPAGTWRMPFKEFGLFTLFPAEAQHKEFQNIKIEPYLLKCKDKVLSVSFNLKYREGRSNKPRPTEEDERDARNRYELNRDDAMPDDIKDLVKTISMTEFGGKKYDELHGQNLTSMILNNDMFIDECYKYGIKCENILPFVISADMDREKQSSYEKELYNDYKVMYPTLSDKEIKNEISVSMGKSKRVINEGDGNTLWRGDV